jgi:hypothetical protein
MGGGLLQLANTNAEDYYLINNPNIDFFKKVYMRHSNFTMTSFEIPCITYDKLAGTTFDNSLSFNNPAKYKIRIPRNGDLVSHIFFRCNLPPIYSEYKKDKGFKYIKNLGSSMIKSASLYIENTLIEKISGEFLYAYHRLHKKNFKNNMFDSMSGHEKELHDPIGNIDLRYRESTLSNENFYNTNYINKNYKNRASITNKNIIVPLSFWFNRDYGLSLPLIALKKHQVYVEIEIRPFKELILLTKEETGIKHTTNDTTFSNLYYAPTGVDNIADFIDEDWNFNPMLDIQYIFLDNKERILLTKEKQEYLIEQVQKTDILNIVGNNTINMRLYHPVKEIIIIPKRSDISLRNQWTNFSNHDSTNMEITNYQTYEVIDGDKTNKSEEDLKNLLKIWNYRKYRDIPTINNLNYKFFTSNIINSMSIDLDGKERLELKDHTYYSKNQIFNHYNGTYLKDILVYSFSKNPSKFTPSGSCNLSEIDNIAFNIDLKKPHVYEAANFPKYSYDISIYTVNYNILSIQHGMGGLVYANR